MSRTTNLRTLKDLGSIRGSRVLVRVDFNLPIERGRVLEDTRIRRTLPTIRALQQRGAACVLVSHLSAGPRASLTPVAAALAGHLGRSHCAFLRERIGTASLRPKLDALGPGDVALLENIRQYPGEEENSAAFAQQLATLGVAYVNDAFGVSHRAHASLVSVARLLPSAAGNLVLEEVAALDRVVSHPTAPFIALIGGAKIETKAAVLARLLARADAVLLGGVLVRPFLAARGYGIGASTLDPDALAIARRILRSSARRALVLPEDVVVGGAAGKRARPRVVPIGAKPHDLCGPKEAIYDIGPATIRAYAAHVKRAQTILWNGPMGWFERPPYHHGSVMLARTIASRSSGRAYGVVGGGETLAVLAMTKMAKYVDHVSTGGGAMLAYIAGAPMPGLDVLRGAQARRKRA